VLILELLKHVARSSGPDESGRVGQALDLASDREFIWAVEAGLGPMLLRAIGDRTPVTSVSRREILLSSDLTARLLHALRIDAATEVIDFCASVGAPVTLLKGISISEQCYPQGHLRTMSDVDLLLPVEAIPVVEAELVRRGYGRGPEHPGEDSHHGAPLLDRERQVWIELHKALFPRSSGLLSGQAFGAASIAAHSVETRLGGRAVYRLSDEFQAAYLAATWVLDLTLCKFHPSFAAALFDAVLLQRKARPAVNWDQVLGWLDNEMALASLHLMLSYLARHGICKPPPPDRLARAQSLVGGVELPIMHAVLDRYLLGARAWTLPIPPPVPGRYNLRRQFLKRALRRSY
jgi:hypothetical protein